MLRSGSWKRGYSGRAYRRTCVCVVGVFRLVDQGQMEGGKNKEKVEESSGE